MQTILYEIHKNLGAKIIDFAGWEMPVYYKGIIAEHNVVRQKVGIFDVSHMGRIAIEGKDAESFLDYLSTNHIIGKTIGTATYTTWCRETGKCVDDLLVYKQNNQKFFVVVNASNRQKDLMHLQQNSKNFDVIIVPKYEQEGILAIQGPQAILLISQIFPEAPQISSMHFLPLNYQGHELILSSTGYTGEQGFEIYAPLEIIPDLWKSIMTLGQTYGIEPIGLGARDTLRLEMGYALYGHELSEEIAPTESISRWTVKWNKEFLGKQALQNLEKNLNRRYEYGVILKDKGIAREGYEVFFENSQIGKVTSGTMSPSLNQAIAIILVNKKLSEGDKVEIQVRANRCSAEVIKLPFYKR